MKFEPGTSREEDFLAYMVERHNIWRRRRNGHKFPWTKDPILQKYKFTNVYRQLDAGTQALTKMLSGQFKAADLVFNVWWYRLFNRAEHATRLGFVPLSESSRVHEYMLHMAEIGEPIFTGAYMTTGVGNELKVVTYLRAVDDAVDNAREVVDFCKKDKTLEGICRELRNCYMVGGFGAYEIACDLRFLHFWKPTDVDRWGNVGPGAKRGMLRMGMEPSVSTMVRLLHRSKANDIRYSGLFDSPWPFELREIEHSLCEFDKYERVRLGQGRPRGRYHHVDSE